MDFWTVYWAFVAFVFGAIVGSFLNVCIWRLPRGESVTQPPSHCPSCDHRLTLLPDMVPLLSQAWYRSRCRYCGTAFSWRYFWVELLTAVTFTAVQLRYTLYAPPGLDEASRTVSAVTAMIFAAALITVFFIDLETFSIPDSVIMVAVLAAVVKDGFLIWKGARPLWQSLPAFPYPVPVPLSLLGGLLALWLLWQFAALATAVLGREAMGAGDSLLLGAMGAFLIPWPLVALAFIAAVFLGTIGGLTGLFLARRAVPEGPESAQPEDAEFQDGSPEAVTRTMESQEEEPSAASARAEIPDGEGMGESAALHRGTAALPEEDGTEEAAVPEVTPDSRWGRLWTVAGTWTAVAAVWIGANLYAGSPALGLAAGTALLLLSAGLLVFGLRLWLRGDKEWLPEMDEVFEGDPGPRFIPFGPYLVAGTFLAMFFGRAILEWYVTKMFTLPAEILADLPWD